MTKDRRYYDPKPRRHGGHRKGVEPAGLKRWRLAHRRTHDPHPGYRRSFSMGPRGGHYFRGPHKRRYDPAPPRRFGRARHYGGKVESGISRYGTIIGAGLTAIYGIWTGYQKYTDAYGPNAGQNYLNTIIGGDIKDKAGTVLSKRMPEITHIWQNEGAMTPIDFLKLKFLGQDATGAQVGSSWVIPFWAGLIATLASPIAKIFTHKGQRFLRPLHKIGVGALAVSTVGALALPGCDKGNPAMLPPPPTQANSNSPQTSPQNMNQNVGAY